MAADRAHLRTTREILAELVSFDTTSRNSNLPLIDWVEAYLNDFGVASERVFDETGQKANLWATIGPQDRQGIVLSGHTDVVPVDGQPWTTAPFELTEREGRLYGRGSCDMKGFLAATLAAVPDFLKRDLTVPIHLAFSYDEEVGCIGIVKLLEALRERPVLPNRCIVGEPTGMQVVTGHKTKRSMRVTVTGRGCHSSLATEGVNAVEYAALMIVRMREIGARLAVNAPQDPAFDVPFSTAHTGTIEGGTALNIVPDRCVFEAEFRVLPGEDADALVEEISAYARETLEPEMRRIAPEAGVEIELSAQFPGLDTPVDAELVGLAKRFARANGHSKVAYGTEAGRFCEMLGIETIVCGPGHIAVAHKPDENVEIEQLDRCDAFLRELADWASA